MHFHYIILGVVFLAIAYAIASTPVHLVAQESEQKLVRNKRCWFFGNHPLANCSSLAAAPVSNGANGGDGINKGYDGQGGYIGNTGIPGR